MVATDGSENLFGAHGSKELSLQLSTL